MSSQIQQPVVVYPNTVTGQPPASHSSHSNGSFGTVFIVLAVIVVVSAMACFLGRLCNRRFHHEKPPKQKHNLQPKERQRERERDLEFGFDNRFPNGKPSGNGEPRGFKLPENGQFRGEPKPAYEGEPRATG